MNGTEALRNELNKLEKVRMMFLRYIGADERGDEVTKHRIRVRMANLGELQTHLAVKDGVR